MHKEAKWSVWHKIQVKSLKKGYNHPGLGKHNELKYKIQSCTRFLSVSIWCWFRFFYSLCSRFVWNWFQTGYDYSSNGHRWKDSPDTPVLERNRKECQCLGESHLTLMVGRSLVYLFLCMCSMLLLSAVFVAVAHSFGLCQPVSLDDTKASLGRSDVSEIKRS